MNLLEFKTQNINLYTEIIEKNEYKVEQSEIEGHNVLDIGANIGFFSLLALSFGAKQIISIEPNRESFLKLCENTQHFPQIHPLQFAVHNGLSKTCETSGTVLTCEVKPSLNGTIPVITLAQAMILFPSDDNNLVLKMDIEGAEFDVLYYAGGSIIKRFKTIYMEIHDKNQEKIIALKNFINFFGYETIHTQVSVWNTCIDGKVISSTPLGQEVIKFERA